MVMIVVVVIEMLCDAGDYDGGDDSSNGDCDY
jgi:hypothetical protein